MSGPIEIILIVAVVGYVLVRRLLGEPVEAKRTLVLPAVLTGVGLITLVKAPQSMVSVVLLIATTTACLALGLLRGASVRVFDKDGVVYLRYTGTTMVLWGVNLAVKFGADLVLRLVDPDAAHAAGSGPMFTLGAGLLAEGLVVMSKALRASGRIMWSKGRNGRPPTMSARLDGLQHTVRETSTSATPGPGQRGGLLTALIDDLRTPGGRGSTPQRSASDPEDDMRITGSTHRDR